MSPYLSIIGLESTVSIHGAGFFIPNVRGIQLGSLTCDGVIHHDRGVGGLCNTRNMATETPWQCFGCQSWGKHGVWSRGGLQVVLGFGLNPTSLHLSFL